MSDLCLISKCAVFDNVLLKPRFRLGRVQISNNTNLFKQLFIMRMEPSASWSCSHLSDSAKPVIPVGVRAKWDRTEVQLWGVPAMQ